MKVVILLLFLIVAPLSISLAEEGTPCGGSGGEAPSTPSAEPSSTPAPTPSGGGEPNSVSDQIGLTGGTCRECDGPLGENPYDRSDRICSYDCDPDGHLIEEGLEAWDNALSSLEDAAHQVVGALANFPSYQYDASHATVPNLQGQ